MMDDDPPEGEWPPKLLMSDFAAQMLDVETLGSPLWLVDRVTLLLKAGRIGPALKLLEELPGAITGTAEAIYAEGREMGRMAATRAAEKATAPAPATMHAAIELAEHIARLGADRVAEVLSVRLVDLQAMLEGRVQPPKAGMRRLRATSR
jgi:hypothetical protein